VAHNRVLHRGNFAGQQYRDNRSQAMHAIENVFIGLEVLLASSPACSRSSGWPGRDRSPALAAGDKIQTDAHTKIVDRLSSNEDLLAYMQSTTGSVF